MASKVSLGDSAINSNRPCEACQKEEGAYVCIDCPTTPVRLCAGCKTQHTQESPNQTHRILTVNEFTQGPPQYQEPTPTVCKLHPHETLKLICEGCTDLLCSLCPYDDRAICPKSIHGKGKHRPVVLKNVDPKGDSLRQEMEAVCKNLTSLHSSADDLQDLIEKRIQADGERWHEAVNQRVSQLCAQARQTVRSQKESLSLTLGSLSRYMNAGSLPHMGDRGSATVSESNSAGRLNSSLHSSLAIGSLTLASRLPPLSVNYNSYSPPTAEPVGSEWYNLVGSVQETHESQPASGPHDNPQQLSNAIPITLQTEDFRLPSAMASNFAPDFSELSFTYRVVDATDDNCFTSQLCSFPVPGPSLLQGTWKKGLRRWTADEERYRLTDWSDDTEYNGLCADGSMAYSSFGKEQKHTGQLQGGIWAYKEEETGAPKLLWSVEEDDAYFRGVSKSTSNLLAVVDSRNTLIRIYEAASGKRVREIGKEAGGKIILRKPMYVAWDPNPDRLYVTDTGDFLRKKKAPSFIQFPETTSIPDSVACLALQPNVHIKWRVMLKHVKLVYCFGNEVYVTHSKNQEDPKVTVLDSKTGDVKTTLACSAVAKGMTQIDRTSFEILSILD